MCALELPCGLVREWVAKAESDLKTAANTLKLKDETLTDSICFHAQQCVEKYLKALLVLKRIEFPKTHDLKEIMSLIPRGARPVLALADQGQLTRYATAARYPGWPDISLPDARRALAIARRVRKEVRRRLPREALRRRKPQPRR